jgi:hypothetical protein
MRKNRWSRKDVKFVIENYSRYTAPELAEKLGNRTLKSITRKIEELRKKGIMSPITTKDAKHHRQNRKNLKFSPAALEEGFGDEEDFYEEQLNDED